MQPGSSDCNPYYFDTVINDPAATPYIMKFIPFITN